MVRATRKSLKFFSYAVALLAGAVLVAFGVQARQDSNAVTDGALPTVTDTAEAAHINGGDFTRQGDDGGGDDDDGGGGDGGGG